MTPTQLFINLVINIKKLKNRIMKLKNFFKMTTKKFMWGFILLAVSFFSLSLASFLGEVQSNEDEFLLPMFGTISLTMMIIVLYLVHAAWLRVKKEKE